MSPLAYAERGWRVFPTLRKNRPLVKWMTAATTDEATIRAWWQRWPRAWIGLVTGEHFVVLDVDVKTSPTGFDTLEELGFPLAFETRTSHTPSGGLHAYFRVPNPPIRNTNGSRGSGIGPQLDWRGIGGYVVAPGMCSGYSWDPHLGIDTPMIEIPAALMPHEKVRGNGHAPDAVSGLDPYGEAALDSACRAIMNAPNGQQENTLNDECFSIGRLAGAGKIPEGFARDTLRWAALKIVSYDTKRPWRTSTIEAKVNKAFSAGLRHPREAGHA
jgi:hypothetical protein